MVSALDLTPRKHKEFEGSQCHVFLGTTLNQKILSITQIFVPKTMQCIFFLQYSDLLFPVSKFSGDKKLILRGYIIA